MKIAVKTIEGGSAGEIELADGVFAVPGPAGGYIIVKDASKRARPKDAPYPAGLRKAAEAKAPEAPAADAPQA